MDIRDALIARIDEQAGLLWRTFFALKNREIMGESWVRF